MKHRPLDPYAELKAMVAASSQVKVSAKLGISRSHINGIVRGKKRIGKDVLDAMGIEAVPSVTYRYKS